MFVREFNAKINYILGIFAPSHVNGGFAVKRDPCVTDANPARARLAVDATIANALDVSSTTVNRQALRVVKAKCFLALPIAFRKSDAAIVLAVIEDRRELRRAPSLIFRVIERREPQLISKRRRFARQHHRILRAEALRRDGCLAQPPSTWPVAVQAVGPGDRACRSCAAVLLVPMVERLGCSLRSRR